MPFASPFGSISTPSFNPSYSNVPQNKQPKAATVPETKPPIKEESQPQSQESSIAEINSGISRKIFTPEAFQQPTTARFTPNELPAPMSPMPVAMPSQFPMQPMFIPPQAPGMPGFIMTPIFLPQAATPQQGVAVQPTEEAAQSQRLNPGRPIFV